VTCAATTCRRLRMCRNKGFDGVEADNVDGYRNDSGFPLAAEDQLGFNRRVAALAHSLGLAAGLKNDLDQVASLEPAFEFAVNEECFRYHECAVLSVFIAAKKPVFHVEYDLAPEQFCPQTRGLGFASMRKHTNLDAWRAPVPSVPSPEIRRSSAVQLRTLARAG
jgi:hypothetical protein